MDTYDGKMYKHRLTREKITTSPRDNHCLYFILAYFLSALFYSLKK